MKGWERKRLGEVCDLIARGIAPKYIEEGGIPVINQKCVRDHKVDLSQSRIHDITSKPINRERLIQTGDVLINSTGVGTLGRVAQVKYVLSDTTIDTHVTIVRPKQGLFFLDFFGYALINIEKVIALSGEGASGQTELSRTKLKEEFYIEYPTSIEAQQRIVVILDEAFAAIDQAKTNLERNLQNARDLFQSRLNQIFTEKGDGWVEKRFSECLKLSSGDGLTAKNMIAGVFPVYGGNGIAGYHNAYNFDGTNIVIGRVGALCGNVRVVEGKFWLTDNAFRITNYNHQFDPYFLTYLLNYKNLLSYARQAAQPVISNSSLKDVKIEFPLSLEEQKQVVAELDNLFERTKEYGDKVEEKLDYLNTLKQSLLQKAFSGELPMQLV
ncbi:MAG: restriction endonuclease subunit S [Chitinophagales bacterium]|nr:restriction endonuclease subunit S [Chitinophagales bacterium]